MRLIGTQEGYWKRIWDKANQRKKHMRKVNGSALTSAADCARMGSIVVQKQPQKQSTSNSFRGNERKSPACSDQPRLEK